MVGVIKFKRGTEASRLGSPALTPAEGEPIFTTDQKKLYIGDGSTQGGVQIGLLTDDPSPKLGGTLNLNNNAIAISLGVAEAVAAGDLCIIDTNGNVVLADASSLSECDGLLLMATETVSVTSPITTSLFVTMGYVSGLSGLTPGTEYYVSTSGTSGNTYTSTKPSASGEFVRKVFTALSTTDLFFWPDQTIIGI